MTARSLLLAAALIVAAVLPTARADERIRAAQSTLAAKGFYFGTPDGQAGATTTEAVRRFQIRQGLPVSGNLDEATARALDLRPAAATPPPTPTTESDRDFLRQQGLAPSGGQSRSQPPPAKAPSPRPAPKPRVRPTPPPTPAPTPTPRPPPQNVFTNVPLTTSNAPVSRAEAAGFLRRFLAAGAGDDVAAEVACYAPEVFYFDQGRQSRRFITRDQNAYRRRWPFRRYELLGEPELTPDGTVRYRLRYQVQSPARVASGETRGEITLRRTRGVGPDGTPGWRLSPSASRRGRTEAKIMKDEL